MKQIVRIMAIVFLLSILPENVPAQEEENKKTDLIESFPLIYQEPELPTGCEITAMTMVLNYYGFAVDKTKMAAQYLPTEEANFYYGSDGLLYGNDMENYFVGDPFSRNGYICGAGAIITAANTFLQDEGSSLRAQNLTGASTESVYKFVSEGTPVMVWGTIGMEERAETDGWYRQDGKFMEWSVNDHGSVLIGVSDDQVVIADPIMGIINVKKQQFEKVFTQRGGVCVILV